MGKLSILKTQVDRVNAIVIQKFFDYFLSRKYVVGDFNAQGPPVPIPNTEVKLCSAENT